MLTAYRHHKLIGSGRVGNLVGLVGLGSRKMDLSTSLYTDDEVTVSSDVYKYAFSMIHSWDASATLPALIRL